MSSNGNFIPRQKLAATNYAAQVHGVLSAPDYDPATVGMTIADVTELGDSVAANQMAMARVNSLKDALKAATKALSGPKGTHRRMVTVLRRMANKARVSDASYSQLIEFGVQRKTLNGTRRNAPKDAPEFSVGHATFGNIAVVFRELGSASPRARAGNATGVQIAVVDAANPVADNEADDAPVKSVSRSPAKLRTTGWPAKVRLYARWATQRGETSPWSGPQQMTVV